MEENKKEIQEEKISEKEKGTSKKIKEEVKEELFEEKKKEKRSFDFKNKKILFVAAFLLFVFLIVFFIFRNTKKTDEITKVDKILSEQYYNIECMDSKCDNLIAYSGDSSKTSEVTIVKSDGTQVAKYSVKFDAEEKVTKTPFAVGSNWFLYKKVDNETKKEVGYSIANKNGEEVYNTENKLSVINDSLILMQEPNKGIDAYSILNASGKILFNNVNEVDTYDNGEILSAEVKGTKKIIYDDGDSVIDNYYISREIIDDDGETLFLLAKDSKNNSYFYFSIEDKKIVGDGFQNYVENDDHTLTISKKENNKIVNYTLDTDGEQTLIGEEVTQSEIVSNLKKDIDSNTYNIYTTSVYDKDQKYILTDNLVENSFGVYEISTKKYTKLFSYKEGASNYYSSIYELNSDKDNKFYQISCSSYSCDSNLFYVYNLSKGSVEYSLNNDALNITNYYQYEDGYKVVKYSYSSSKEDYKGKMVLLDKDNNEITKSDNRIVVLDKKQLVGNEINTSLILYSAKDGKVLNDDNNLASKISVAGNKYYKYSTEDKTIILDTNGKEVLNTSSKNDLMYSDKLIIYIEDKTINMLNGTSGKVNTYKLGDNEKMNDASGELIPPYRGALFINNSVDKQAKVVNSSGKTIKTIDNAEIENVNYTTSKDVLIITKKFTDNKTLYGAYLAK